MPSPYVHFDPLLSPAEAETMVRICRRFGTYSTYGAGAAPEERGQQRFAPGVPQRYDAALNFIRTGGRFARRDDPAMLAARTNYFRGTYYYEGRGEALAGVEPFLRHEGLADAARRVHGRPVVVPAIVYANLLLPGQELAVHTDVPEFRGANRTVVPQWLCVVMQHSRLFERWRRPIATGIAYFSDCAGGDLAFYADGPERAPRTIPARHNTGIVLDTDTVFHGVDRVASDDPVPPFSRGMRLRPARGGTWCLFDDERELAHYAWEELRFSVSWKAYCYEDEADRRRAETHADDLSLDRILATLVDDLRARGRLDGERPDDEAFARLLIEEYVRFPRPLAA
ncbi:MAG: hypothetical protein DCC71_00710 [Proteobacteria bacterium]|nr:MAG: hypothetical protein DCC71_00710 [Pseudomonadota bacterium]